VNVQTGEEVAVKLVLDSLRLLFICYHTIEFAMSVYFVIRSLRCKNLAK